MTIDFTYENDNGEEVTISLPAKYEVCFTCQGEGKHVNPAVDGHGISQEEFDEDPDFAEAYFNGNYDVTCDECKGKRVVPVVDEERANADDLKLYNEKLDDDASYERLCAYERRWGC